MGTKENIVRIDNDIKTLWENSKLLEDKLLGSIDKVDTRVNDNNTDLQLLNKDVRTAIDGMKDFMEIFKVHDEKEMEKYDTIETSISEVKASIIRYSSLVEDQGKDIAELKQVAEKGKTYMIKGTAWLVAVGTIVSVLWTAHPYIKEYVSDKAVEEYKSKHNYTEEEKIKYYTKRYQEAKALLEERKQKDK